MNLEAQIYCHRCRVNRGDFLIKSREYVTVNHVTREVTTELNICEFCLRKLGAALDDFERKMRGKYVEEEDRLDNQERAILRYFRSLF